MPVVIDFKRRRQFDVKDVINSGVYLGDKIYWKLYALENYYRIIIHSILSVQYADVDWWSTIDGTIRKKAEDNRKDYLRKSKHTIPGKHLIYFTTLYYLNEIVRDNPEMFSKWAKKIEELVLKIDDIKLPRNVIAHMNFPNKFDRQYISAVYEEFKKLIENIKEDGSVLLKAPK